MYNENDFESANSIFSEVLLRSDLTDNFEISHARDALELYAKTHGLEFTGDIRLKDNLSVKYEAIIPDKNELLDNYPNPFNPTTTIDYSIKKDGLVSLKIYDILGSEVVSLVNENQVAGDYSVQFNASELPSGIYIYRLTSRQFTSSKKLILLK